MNCSHDIQPKEPDLSSEIILPNSIEEESEGGSHRLVRVRRFDRDSIVIDVGIFIFIIVIIIIT